MHNFSEEDKQVQMALRRRFFDEYRSQIELGKFAVEDVRRVRVDDSWLNQFIQRCDSDLDVALPILVECLKWRQDFGVNNLSILRLKPYFERQVMYIRGFDVDEKPILWFHIRNHRKDNPPKDSQALLVYWLEKHNREQGDTPLVIVFDMTNSGLQNMDLELIKFLLHCLKFYYPQMLAYLLVYEIPWILNAAWKLVRSWLDPVAQKKIIFVNQGSVQQYIGADELPTCMGGDVDYTFTMDQLSDSGSRTLFLDVNGHAFSSGEDIRTPDSDYLSLESEYRSPTLADEGFSSPQMSPGSGITQDSVMTGSALLDSEPEPYKRKSVKFADQNSDYSVTPSVFSEKEGSPLPSGGGSPISPVTTSSNGTAQSPSSGSTNGGNLKSKHHHEHHKESSSKGHHQGGSHQSFSRALSTKAKEIAESRLASMGTPAEGQVLAISPPQEVVLQCVPGELERVDAIALKNEAKNPVIFKIKITSPEKFRVRPSSGVIRPDDKMVVNVYLQTGYQDTVHRDKFLIMSYEVTEEARSALDNPEKISQLWKDAPQEKLMEHRLKCRVDDTLATKNEARIRQAFLTPQEESNPLTESDRSILDHLRNENRVMKVMLILACSLLAVLFIHQRIMFTSLQDQIQEITGNAQCHKQ